MQKEHLKDEPRESSSSPSSGHTLNALITGTGVEALGTLHRPDLQSFPVLGK